MKTRTRHKPFMEKRLQMLSTSDPKFGEQECLHPRPSKPMKKKKGQTGGSSAAGPCRNGNLIESIF